MWGGLIKGPNVPGVPRRGVEGGLPLLTRGDRYLHIPPYIPPRTYPECFRTYPEGWPEIDKRNSQAHIPRNSIPHIPRNSQAHIPLFAHKVIWIRNERSVYIYMYIYTLYIYIYYTCTYIIYIHIYIHILYIYVYTYIDTCICQCM